MGWVKLDDGFPEHPKVERAGDHAAWLYVCGLAYCSRTLSDGFIPKGRLKHLCGLPRLPKLAAVLVDVGLWDELGDEGWQVHDYGRHQRTKAEVEDIRDKNRRRVRDWRERHRNDDT